MKGLRNQPWYPLLPLVPIHILAYICNFIDCFYNAAPSFFGVGFSLLYVGLCFYLLLRFRQNAFWLKFYAIFSLVFLRQSLHFLSGYLLWKCGQYRPCPFPAVCACLLRADRDSLSGNHSSLPIVIGRNALSVFPPQKKKHIKKEIS